MDTKTLAILAGVVGIGFLAYKSISASGEDAEKKLRKKYGIPADAVGIRDAQGNITYTGKNFSTTITAEDVRGAASWVSGLFTKEKSGADLLTDAANGRRLSPAEAKKAADFAIAELMIEPSFRGGFVAQLTSGTWAGFAGAPSRPLNNKGFHLSTIATS